MSQDKSSCVSIGLIEAKGRLIAHREKGSWYTCKKARGLFNPGPDHHFTYYPQPVRADEWFELIYSNRIIGLIDCLWEMVREAN